LKNWVAIPALILVGAATTTTTRLYVVSSRSILVTDLIHYENEDEDEDADADADGDYL
jgi:hypothetical protein